MSFETFIIDSSRISIDIAVNAVESNPILLQHAIDLCKHKYPVSMRAARVVQLYTERHYNEIIPYLSFISNELLNTKVDGVKRSFLKILFITPSILAIENSALLLDKCIDWLQSDKEPIAVRAYCIDLLIKFANEEPELKNEIRLTLENIPLEEYPSLKLRRKNGLKMLKMT
jgi:hypothetical protein